MNDVEHDCVGALLVREGKLLLGRRAINRIWLAGAWDVFGGHIEPGETPEQALRRELDEELGVLPSQLRRLGTLSGDGPASWRLHLYVVSAWEGEPRNRQPQEHAQMCWCTLGQAQQRLAGAHPDFARLLAQAV